MFDYLFDAIRRIKIINHLQGSWIDFIQCSMLPLDSSTRPGEPSTCIRSSVSSTVSCWCVRRNSELPNAVFTSRSRLRSASTALLHVPRSNHKTIGDRAFPVAAAKVWHCLPPSITSLPSLPQLRKALMTELFRCSNGEHSARLATGH